MEVILPRLRSALRYLSWADPPYKWRVRRSSCPNCGRAWFVGLRPSAFMTRCISCGANCTNMALIPVIQGHMQSRKVTSAYELSTYGATLEWLRRHVPEVTTSEYFSGEPLGAMVNGMLNQDVQQLTFPAESFDLVTSNQVFEHVPDDVKGYSECYRVLRPGGALVFSVPMHDFPETRRIAEIVDGKTIIYEPEYHDSRLGGPKSALAFWRHSIHDLSQRVASVGFTAELLDVPIANRVTKVLYAVKG